MPRWDEVHRVKKAVEAEYVGRPGITGVATGHKIVAGRVTKDLSIRFYVAEKRDVPAKERIPEEIQGIKTDVIQMRFVAHPLRVRVSELRAMADNATYDPLRGGISIGPCRVIGGFVYVGTLGAIVRDRTTGDPMMLSNYHVMAVDDAFTVGDTIAQPSRVDGGLCPGDVVGELTRAVLSGTTAGGAAPGVDGAVARITNRGHQCSIVDVGDVTGTAVAAAGLAVRKRGRTTGLTHGTVDTIDLTVNIDYGDGLGVVTLEDQIGIDVDPAQSTEFGLGGDSGSAVVNAARRIVGLYYGGNIEEVDAAGNVVVAEGVYGVANPIQAALDALDVTLCVAKAPKLEKLEKLEKVEKWEKIEKWEKPEFKELKDNKNERKELLKIEKPEIREPKDFVEPKELLEPKDIREPKVFREPKGLREPKDIREPKDLGEPKGLGEPKFQEPGPLGGDPFAAIEERLARLERSLGQMLHFIRVEQRPDLSGGALKHEPDVTKEETPEPRTPRARPGDAATKGRRRPRKRP